MAKRFELVQLYDHYTAVLYNRLGGYWVEKYFIGYNKKQVLYKLRHDYDCIVGKGW